VANVRGGGKIETLSALRTAYLNTLVDMDTKPFIITFDASTGTAEENLEKLISANPALDFRYMERKKKNRRVFVDGEWAESSDELNEVIEGIEKNLSRKPKTQE
jgi:hypothetical protein